MPTRAVQGAKRTGLGAGPGVPPPRLGTARAADPAGGSSRRARLAPGREGFRCHRPRGTSEAPSIGRAGAEDVAGSDPFAEVGSAIDSCCARPHYR